MTLPLTVQFIIAVLAYALNERMARKAEYLREEKRVLKEALRAATGMKRIPLSDEQRRRLAAKGRALTPAEREACCQIVRPTTILAWFRQLVACRYDGSQVPKPGRPRKPNDIRKLVLRMATENPGWGYIRSHCETLYACDFFGVETLGTVRYMVFIVIELKSRAVQIAGIRINPNWAWTQQIARNLLDPVDGFLRDATHLIHDRDPLFTKAWTTLLKSTGAKCVRIPASSPNCNSYAERFVRTVRSESLDYFLVLGERHLRYLLREYCAHYRGERFHQGMGGQLAGPSAAASNDNGIPDAIQCRSRLGGLLHFDHRQAA